MLCGPHKTTWALLKSLSSCASLLQSTKGSGCPTLPQAIAQEEAISVPLHIVVIHLQGSILPAGKCGQAGVMA